MDGNINLIRKIAWSFYHTTGIDWDDLFQEAAIAYLEGLKTYDSDQGAISTYMWKTITSRLINYIKEEQRFSKGFQLIEEYPPIVHHDDNFLQGLTKDAEEIANIVLNSSKRFGELKYSDVRDRVYHLMRVREWTFPRITQALKELELACSN